MHILVSTLISLPSFFYYYFLFSHCSLIYFSKTFPSFQKKQLRRVILSLLTSLVAHLFCSLLYFDTTGMREMITARDIVSSIISAANRKIQRRRKGHEEPDNDDHEEEKVIFFFFAYFVNFSFKIRKIKKFLSFS